MFMSDMEKFLVALKEGNFEDLPEPNSNIEKYLAAMCGMEVVIPEPQSRADGYLKYLAENGVSGGGGSGEDTGGDESEEVESYKLMDFRYMFYKGYRMDDYEFIMAHCDEILYLDNAFYQNGSSKIENIKLNLSDGFRDGTQAFYNSTSVKKVELVGGTTNPWTTTRMFNGCSNLEEIVGFHLSGVANQLVKPFPIGTAAAPCKLRRLVMTGGAVTLSSASIAFSVAYCAFERSGAVEMFENLPTTAAGGTITLTGNPCCTGTDADGNAVDLLTDDDRLIATEKNWTIVE